MKQNGTVVAAQCSCVAGQGEACSHVAALMIYLEDKMGTAQAVVLRRQPFVPRYGHCLTFSPLWVSGEDKELRRRAFSVSVWTVYGTTADWHRVLKKLRSTVFLYSARAKTLCQHV